MKMVVKTGAGAAATGAGVAVKRSDGGEDIVGRDDCGAPPAKRGKEEVESVAL
jgi:hypothetical protein